MILLSVVTMAARPAAFGSFKAASSSGPAGAPILTSASAAIALALPGLLSASIRTGMASFASGPILAIAEEKPAARGVGIFVGGEQSRQSGQAYVRQGLHRRLADGGLRVL